MKSNFFDNLGKFKLYSLYISKCVTLLLSSYYIYNSNDYSITFNIPPWARWNWLLTITGFLDNIGTFLLVFPVVIIVLSFYFSNPILNFISALFSFFTNIFTIATACKRFTLQEYFNAKIFTVFNKYTFETKKALFKGHLSQKLENDTSLTVEKLNFIQNRIDEVFNLEYLEKIKITPITELPFLVNTMVERFSKEYNVILQRRIEAPVNTNLTNNIYDVISPYINVPNAVKVIIVGAIIVIGYKLYRALFPDNTHAKLTNDIAEEASHTTEIQGDEIRRNIVTDTAVNGSLELHSITAQTIRDTTTQLFNRTEHVLHFIDTNNIQQEAINQHLADVVNINADILDGLRNVSHGVLIDFEKQKTALAVVEAKLDTLTTLVNSNAPEGSRLSSMAETALFTRMLKHEKDTDKTNTIVLKTLMDLELSSKNHVNSSQLQKFNDDVSHNFNTLENTVTEKVKNLENRLTSNNVNQPHSETIVNNMQETVTGLSAQLEVNQPKIDAIANMQERMIELNTQLEGLSTKIVNNALKAASNYNSLAETSLTTSKTTELLKEKIREQATRIGVLEDEKTSLSIGAKEATTRIEKLESMLKNVKSDILSTVNGLKTMVDQIKADNESLNASVSNLDAEVHSATYIEQKKELVDTATFMYEQEANYPDEGDRTFGIQREYNLLHNTLLEVSLSVDPETKQAINNLQ